MPLALSAYPPASSGQSAGPDPLWQSVKALEQSLRQKCSMRKAKPLLEPFRVLADDREFWNRMLDGLAVLGAPRLFRVYVLQRPIPEPAVVAESFHTKPLMRILQSADRYQILGLNRQSIRLFEGNRDALDEIEPAEGVPRTITEALGEGRKQAAKGIAQAHGPYGIRKK